VLIEFATPGMIAPAATATKPAIRAYSMRSWPLVSCQSLNFQAEFVIIFKLSFLASFLRKVMVFRLSKIVVEEEPENRLVVLKLEGFTASLKALSSPVLRLKLLTPGGFRIRLRRRGNAPRLGPTLSAGRLHSR